MFRESRREPAKTNVMKTRKREFQEGNDKYGQVLEKKLNNVRILRSYKVINDFSRAISLD